MTSNLTRFAIFAYLSGERAAVPSGLLEMLEDEFTLLRSTFRYGKRYASGAMHCRLILSPCLPGAGISMEREPPRPGDGKSP